MHDIFSNNNFGGKYATSLLCADGSLLQIICRVTYYIIAGYNPVQLNTVNINLIIFNLCDRSFMTHILCFVIVDVIAVIFHTRSCWWIDKTSFTLFAIIENR